MNPPQFLSEFWRDVISVSGLVGVVLTVAGLVVAYLQLRKSVGANQAAIDALNESKARYERYLIGQVNRLFSEARLLISSEEWARASMRVNDVAELLAQIRHDEFDVLEDRLRDAARQFLRIGAAKIQFKSIQSKWAKLEAEVGKCIARRHGPFPHSQETADADEGKTP